MNRTKQMRERLAGVFPEPDAVSSLKYADTEFGELLDALLRQDRPDDKRNNGREHDPVAELGQLIVMVETAALAISKGNVGNTSGLVALQYYHESMADLYDAMLVNGGTDKHSWHFIGLALGDLAGLVGTSVPEARRLACERFEAKHAIEGA